VLVVASTVTSVALLSSDVASTGLDFLMPRRLAFRSASTVSAGACGLSDVALLSSAAVSTRLDSLMPRRRAFRAALPDSRSVWISSAIAEPGGAGMVVLVALAA
jgi:hypothetical protein